MRALRVVLRAFTLMFVLWAMFFAWLYTHTGLRKLIRRGILRELPAGTPPPATRVYEPLGNQRIVRRAFEFLGPSFIKLGQIIASSPGLFPKRYSEEFQRCLDRVKPFRLERLKATVAAELGRPISEVFATFDDVPLGSASIAQVHAATLADGTEVVVKVQRPGIRVVVDADIWWMRRFAWLLDKLFKGARLANIRGVIEDFDRTIHEEIDFKREAANLEQFNMLMKKYGLSDVRAPCPTPDLVTVQVLTMERFRGFKADDVAGIATTTLDPEVYLRKGLRAWLMTMMLDGFFHGDAHAGNLMLMPPNGAYPASVGFLDFGIIGRFTDLQRAQVMRYVLAFSAQDYTALAGVMSEMSALTQKVDNDALVKDLARVYSPLVEKSFGEIRYEEIMPEITAMAFRHGIKLPSEFLLILKQLLFFDRYAKLSAPNLNVFSDFRLVDFLFTPLAMQAKIDFNVLMPLLQRIRQRHVTKYGEPGAA